MDREEIERLKGFLGELKRYRDTLYNPDSILGEEKPKRHTFLEWELSEKSSKEELIKKSIEELREKLVLEHGTF